MIKIQSIDAWPPGTLMCYDNSIEVKRIGDRNIKQFIGIGIVVASTRSGTIWVLWGANCRDTIKEYDVRTLNPRVIKRVE